MRVVVDSNVVYAGLYSRRGASYQILRLIRRRSITPALSVSMISEYEDVLGRPPLGDHLSEDSRKKFLDYICSVGALIEVHFLWRPYLKDGKDDMVLELAVASGSEQIITHNVRDFQGVGRFGIVANTPRDFLKSKTGG